MTMVIRFLDEALGLELIDAKTGCCWVLDFIGNRGVIGEGLDFEHDADSDEYVAKDQETFDYWVEAVRKENHIEYLKELAVELHGATYVFEAVAAANIDSTDLDQYQAEMTKLLEELAEWTEGEGAPGTALPVLTRQRRKDD